MDEARKWMERAAAQNYEGTAYWIQANAIALAQ